MSKIIKKDGQETSASAHQTSPKKPFMQKIKEYFKPQGIQIDMLRYRANGTSYLMTILGIICFAVGFSLIYSNTKVGSSDSFSLFGITSVGFWAGADIVINILLLLFMFLAASKMKAYSKKWGIISICMGCFQIVRIFAYPLSLMTAGILSSVLYIAVIVLYSMSGGFIILSGFISIYRKKTLQNYLKTVKPIENEKIAGTK